LINFGVNEPFDCGEKAGMEIIRAYVGDDNPATLQQGIDGANKKRD